MSRYPFEEFTRVEWVPAAAAIADLAAPHLGEILTGTDITCFLTKDGLTPGGSTAKITGGSLCTRVDGQTIGSVSYDATLKLYRDNQAGGDTAWDLAVWAAEGYLIVRRGLPYATAFAVGQKVEVYQAQMGEPVPAASAANAQQTFMLSLAIQAAELKATIAAGS